MGEELKSVYNNGMAVKRDARFAIGMDYTLDQLINHQPEQPADLAGHAEGTASAMRVKGVPLPDFVLHVLGGMKSSGAKVGAKPKKGD